MWESRAAFEREFSKRRWESALFADFHGRGIFQQAFSPTTDTTEVFETSLLLIGPPVDTSNNPWAGAPRSANTTHLLQSSDATYAPRCWEHSSGTPHGALS